MKRDWFERSFLEHAVKTRSQYDETCRRMAQQILDLLDEAGQRTPLHVEGERCGALSTAWECDKPPGHDGFHVFSEVRALGRVLTAAPPALEVQAGEAVRWLAAWQCMHANENPRRCSCPPNCYCNMPHNTCAVRRGTRERP